MSNPPTATRGDINDLLNVLQDFMQIVDERFTGLEDENTKARTDIRRILSFLDYIAKRQEISDDERLVL